MLVTAGGVGVGVGAGNEMSLDGGRPPSRAPSILDSPTLARVERARLRLEASSQQQLSYGGVVGSGNGGGGSSSGSASASVSNATTINRDDSLERSILDPKQSLLAGRIPVGSMTGPIKRGLLWQQRDRLFSRWKERYFVLTRDYLHCFKRASGSANERASDMGQFIFKVKLVDVEKVEWLNRRSYSVIGLLLGREGRVLLRCHDGLEDWFELLEECTLTSKERRRALKIAQGPRSRASLAAPVTHASLQTHHFGLGGNYTSALDDWLMANGNAIGGRHKIGGGGSIGGTNPFLLSDSVPDLSVLNNENHNHVSGLSTNHSTPQKIPYGGGNGGGGGGGGGGVGTGGNTGGVGGGVNINLNMSRYSNGYASQNSSFGNGLYGSPRRIFINSTFGSNHIVDEEAEDGEVQLRRPRIFRGSSNNNAENGNELDRDWLYRKPRPPTDMRHSVQPILPTSNNIMNISHSTPTKVVGNNVNDVDYSAHDSGLDTPPSTHRPSSYREGGHASPRDSTETTGSSSRGTLLNSPGGSFRQRQTMSAAVTNLNQVNGGVAPSRYGIQERILKIRNEEERCASIKSANRLNHNELYDPNQNRYYKGSNGAYTPTSHHTPTHHTPHHTPQKHQHQHQHQQQQQQSIANNANNNAAAATTMATTINGNVQHDNAANGSAMFRERYQHPALTAIINEAQGLKFRDRSHSDCQQLPPRRSVNNNPSPLTPRRNNLPIFGTPTRV